MPGSPPVGRFFANGLIVDFILAFMAVELFVLILVRKQPWRRVQLIELMVNMGAGAALLLALRAALRESAWQRVALWLSMALVLHLWELALRRSMHRTR